MFRVGGAKSTTRRLARFQCLRVCETYLRVESRRHGDLQCFVSAPSGRHAQDLELFKFKEMFTSENVALELEHSVNNLTLC